MQARGAPKTHPAIKPPPIDNSPIVQNQPPPRRFRIALNANELNMISCKHMLKKRPHIFNMEIQMWGINDIRFPPSRCSLGSNTWMIAKPSPLRSSVKPSNFAVLTPKTHDLRKLLMCKCVRNEATTPRFLFFGPVFRKPTPGLWQKTYYCSVKSRFTNGLRQWYFAGLGRYSAALPWSPVN